MTAQPLQGVSVEAIVGTMITGIPNRSAVIFAVSITFPSAHPDEDVYLFSMDDPRKTVQFLFAAFPAEGFGRDWLPSPLLRILRNNFVLPVLEVRISPFCPNRPISCGNSLSAPSPWMYFPGNTAFKTIPYSFVLRVNTCY